MYILNLVTFSFTIVKARVWNSTLMTPFRLLLHVFCIHCHKKLLFIEPVLWNSRATINKPEWVMWICYYANWIIMNHPPHTEKQCVSLCANRKTIYWLFSRHEYIEIKKTRHSLSTVILKNRTLVTNCQKKWRLWGSILSILYISTFRSYSYRGLAFEHAPEGASIFTKLQQMSVKP